MKPLTRKDFTTNINQLEDLIITEEQLKQILEYQEFHESFYPYSKRLEQENKMYLSKIDELTKETKQRGLIIGKKYEEIKQLRVDYKIIDGEALDYRKKWRELLPKHQNLKDSIENIQIKYNSLLHLENNLKERLKQIDELLETERNCDVFACTTKSDFKQKLKDILKKKKTENK